MKTGFDPSPATLCSGFTFQEQLAFFFSPFCMLLPPFPFPSWTEAAGKTPIFREESETAVRNLGFQPPTWFSFSRKQIRTRSHAVAATQEPPASQGSAVPPWQPSSAMLKHRVQSLGVSPPTSDTFHQWPLTSSRKGHLSYLEKRVGAASATGVRGKAGIILGNGMLLPPHCISQ